MICVSELSEYPLLPASRHGEWSGHCGFVFDPGFCLVEEATMLEVSVILSHQQGGFCLL